MTDLSIHSFYYMVIRKYQSLCFLMKMEKLMLGCFTNRMAVLSNFVVLAFWHSRKTLSICVR